jgi:hypothetical protein
MSQQRMKLKYLPDSIDPREDRTPKDLKNDEVQQISLL